MRHAFCFKSGHALKISSATATYANPHAFAHRAGRILFIRRGRSEPHKSLPTLCNASNFQPQCKFLFFSWPPSSGSYGQIPG